MRDRDANDMLVEMYARDPELALGLLHELLEDGEAGEIQIFVHHLAKAFPMLQPTVEQSSVSSRFSSTLSSEPAVAEWKSLLTTLASQLPLRPVKAA